MKFSAVLATLNCSSLTTKFSS